MVAHLLESGPSKGVDLAKLCDKHEQFDREMKAEDADDARDDNCVQDDGKGGLMTLSPAPQVGEADIPVRDMRYADQRQERFDDAPGHIPTFEDED